MMSLHATQQLTKGFVHTMDDALLSVEMFVHPPKECLVGTVWPGTVTVVLAAMMFLHHDFWNE